MQKFIVIAGTLLLAATSAGCSAAGWETDPVATAPARLVGGTPDKGDPAVVLFQTTGPSGGECTAEFVSTTVLLTAAHCVLTESGKPIAGAGFRIYQGNDFANAKPEDWITIDPSSVHPHPSFQGDDHDIAVAVLSEPVRVTPLAFTTQPLVPSDIGKSVRLVGYGSNVVGSSGGDDGFGLKRELTTTIVGVEPSWVEVGKAGETACGGDSGGPALLAIDGIETIVGLDSFSDAVVDCSASEFYQRVDTESDFIAPFMTPPPDAGGAGAGGEGGGGEAAAGVSTGAGASSDRSGDAPAPDASGGCSIGHAPLDRLNPRQRSSRGLNPRQRSSRGSSVLALALALVFGLALRRRRRGLAAAS